MIGFAWAKDSLVLVTIFVRTVGPTSEDDPRRTSSTVPSWKSASLKQSAEVLLGADGGGETEVGGK